MADSIRKLLKDEKQLTQIASAAFTESDSDKSGFIDEKELYKVMVKACAALNCDKPTQGQVKELLKRIDHNKDGKVSLDEYVILFKMILQQYVKNLEDGEEDKRNDESREERKKETEIENQVNKQLQLFEKYLEDSGISTAFQIIYTEILMKKIDSENVFTYTAMRLRQIGKEIAHLLPENLTAKLVDHNDKPRH
jgi:hypothetical protein